MRGIHKYHAQAVTEKSCGHFLQARWGAEWLLAAHHFSSKHLQMVLHFKVKIWVGDERVSVLTSAPNHRNCLTFGIYLARGLSKEIRICVGQIPKPGGKYINFVFTWVFMVSFLDIING